MGGSENDDSLLDRPEKPQESIGIESITLVLQESSIEKVCVVYNSDDHDFSISTAVCPSLPFSWLDSSPTEGDSPLCASGLSIGRPVAYDATHFLQDHIVSRNKSVLVL